jgi:hypothetical protein
MPALLLEWQTMMSGQNDDILTLAFILTRGACGIAGTNDMFKVHRCLRNLVDHILCLNHGTQADLK